MNHLRLAICGKSGDFPGCPGAGEVAALARRMARGMALAAGAEARDVERQARRERAREDSIRRAADELRREGQAKRQPARRAG